MRLALFDLDGTLFDGDTDDEWAALLADEGIIERAEAERVRACTQAGTLTVEEFYRWHLRAFAQLPRPRLLELRQRLFEERIRPLLSEAMCARLAHHQRDADATLIVTATNRFLVEPIARSLDVEFLLATELQEVDGRFTGEVRGVPCFREGKLEHVDDWLRGRGATWADVADSWFYTDSPNDLPLLERSHRGAVVGAGAELRERAAREGWEQLEL